jgi:hypothetical protein
MISEFEASLVYRVSSTTARIKNKKNKKKKREEKEEDQWLACYLLER